MLAQTNTSSSSVATVAKYLTYSREDPTEPIWSQNCMVHDFRDVIMRAKFWIEIYMDYGFTGVKFSIL